MSGFDLYVVNNIYFTFQQSYQVFPIHLRDQQEHPMSPPVQKTINKLNVLKSVQGICFQSFISTEFFLESIKVASLIGLCTLNGK